MSIRLHSEFDFIRSILATDQRDHSVVVPNGDDAAVVRSGANFLVISVDSVVEGTHFSFELSSPSQVGIKALESAISDVVAMGAAPRFVLISLTAPKTLPVARLKEVFEGIQKQCAERQIIVLGGDTTSGGSSLTISVTAFGYISDETRICRRSGAKIGDLIYISGPLGGSAAGLHALKLNLPDLDQAKKRHQEPRCRADLVKEISPVANALIDISDGLSSEIHHICCASKVGCLVHEERIPLFPGVEIVAEHLGIDPFELAWNGGEDYELLFTVSPETVAYSAITVPGICIGDISDTNGVRAIRDGLERTISPGGYDHFIKTAI